MPMSDRGRIELPELGADDNLLQEASAAYPLSLK